MHRCEFGLKVHQHNPPPNSTTEYNKHRVLLKIPSSTQMSRDIIDVQILIIITYIVICLDVHVYVYIITVTEIPTLMRESIYSI